MVLQKVIFRKKMTRFELDYILVIADLGTLMPTWHVYNIVDNIGPFLLILVDLVFLLFFFTIV